MSIYKGGYILADISDTNLELGEMVDLLPQDLKDYLKSTTKGELFSKEVLIKPLKLLVNINGYITMIEFKLISDDFTEIRASCLDADGKYNFSIDNTYFKIIASTIS